MVEITEEQLKDAKFYHNVFVLISAFATGKKVPGNIDVDYNEVNSALRLIRQILSMKE